MEDSYAVSFIDPVDTSVYDDYLDVVEEPMCLKDVQRKLENGDYTKYMQVTDSNSRNNYPVCLVSGSPNGIVPPIHPQWI